MERNNSNSINEVSERRNRLDRAMPHQALPRDENKPDEEPAALIDSGQVEKGPMLSVLKVTDACCSQYLRRKNHEQE